MTVRRVIPRDAIPSVDDPAFVPVDEYDGDDSDDVVAVEGEAEPSRAYPVRYLHYHEIVNAHRDGHPIAVTWCPLCASAVVYDRALDAGSRPDVESAGATASDDLVLSFGVSGKLADDDLVLYDRQTESEWKQSRGVAIVGPLEGSQLTALPAAVTSFGTFREAHPDGEVLAPPGGRSEAASEDDDPAPIDYDADPYERYFETDGFGLAAHRGEGSRKWNRDDLDPKAIVLGVERDGEALGFPLPRVAAADGVVTATVGDLDVVVFATDDGIHAFEDPGFDWRRVRGGFSGDGALYDGATGEAVDAPATHAGSNRNSLVRVPTRRLFAFAWQDDHGPDSFAE